MSENINKTFSNLYCTSEIYAFLGKTLASQIPKSIVIIVHLDVTLKMAYVIGFYGINLPWFNKLVSILGINPVGKHFNITEEGQNYYYSDKSFRKFNGSIYEFAGGQLPDWVTKSVGKLFGIKSIYTIALNHAKKPMGTALVFNRQDASPDFKGLESFVDDVSKRLYDVIDDNIRNLDVPSVKDVFIKNMLNNLSHEIRTPLNGIVGMLRLIEMKAPSSNSIDTSMYRNAWSSAETLTHNVESLVLASELATHTIELNLEASSTQDILDEVNKYIDKLRSQYLDRNIIFNFTVEKDRYIHLDVFYFLYIVKELVLNALKFSSNQIEIDLIIDADLTLQIKDYGIGLTEKELEVIFEHFVKVSNPSKIYRGMGLGLYNCKQLATLFGGSLQMTSTCNVGSNIVLKVPIVEKDMKIV